MRNKHTFNEKIEVKCPFANCGKTFDVDITVEYVTNQIGDVIAQKVI